MLSPSVETRTGIKLIMSGGRDVILISSVEWDFLWQIQQEVSVRLARAGSRVLYVENTGVRAPTIHDAGRVARRLKHWAASVSSRSRRRVRSGVHIVSPLVLPPFGAPWQRVVNRHLLRQQVKRVARALQMRDPLLLTYLPTDTALDLIRLLSTPRSVVAYHCAADFSQLTSNHEGLRRSEEALLKLCDVVFAGCSQLAEYCRRLNDDVHVLPPGVDFDVFLPRNGGGEIRSESSSDGGTSRVLGGDGRPSLRRPVIGYVGGLHRHVDFTLLTRMARARPDWSWVFVGPLQTAVNGLAELPNVHLLGRRPHGDLARYIREMDVCLVPYLNNAATATVVPVKVNEYLAVGKPVVSTKLPTIRDFNEQYKVLLTADNRPDSFLQAIEQALCTEDDVETIKRRREVAALNDWQVRLNVMSDLIETAARRKSTAEKFPSPKPPASL
jgi:glycosyltransferase involved in cell wall biosynthesis